MAVTWNKLAYEADVVTKALFNANTIIMATDDNTPITLEVTEQTLVGRITSGVIDALTATEVRTLLAVEENADVTDATNVAAAGAVMESDYTGIGALVVGSGVGTATVLGVGTANQILSVNADVTALDWIDQPAAGTGDFKADGSVPMTGDLNFDDNEAKDMIFQQVANEAAVAAYATPVVGKVLFATAELTLHVCTVAA